MTSFPGLERLRPLHRYLGIACLVAAPALYAGPVRAEDLPYYLEDRGTGVATSLFGTYVRDGELLIYPFYEYTVNKDQEYAPEELGFVGTQDYRGKNTEHEALIFLSYGLSENVAVELESALWTTATQHKSPDDSSAMPSEFTESGFGDTQAELRWRWWKESETRPEFWSYFETVFPFQKNRKLIGTQDWEVIQGFGLTRGFRFGTLTTRASMEYQADEGKVAFGEYALEYLKRLSSKWRTVLAVEGEEDEVAAIVEVQRQIGPNALLKLNNGFGLTSKAPELAPEVGIAFSW
ncbi:MAG TPA: hypothetical protein VFX78_14045 [Candidatus Eisenbacteria bacterium]|jgi:hypothetical protein|nr:hypothetical protein [Candidatus Eisenbacteria bacterium]